MKETDIILFLTEGERLDPRILNIIRKEFLPKQNIKIFPICLNIYNLYQEILQNSNDFEQIDIFAVIKEICKKQKSSDNPELQAIRRNQVSSIYLFFDYDGHDTLAPYYPNCLSEMLDFFNNETENGKLYINYPMVESYKHPLNNRVELVDICPQNNHYKNQVSKICNKKYEQVTKMTKLDWLNLFLPHLKSTCHLFYDRFSLTEDYYQIGQMTQDEIYNLQQVKYITKMKKVMVLSSFSWFLLDYFGEKLFCEWKEIEATAK